ncbi:MAG: hypothetical protein IPP08_04925 [Chlorobiota bacterium]|jgi:hypothetical protein|nr:hypothetical protein [Chlorobiota bacterium]QQS67512.1 MAG: hypothetical protein IPP08_04925 [Chlorobiota bacterium]
MRTNNLLKSIAGLSLAFIVSTISLYSQETIQLNGNVDLTSTSGITIISQGTNKIVSYNDSFKVQSNYAFKKSKDGKFAFNVSYTIENAGVQAPNKAFTSRLILDNDNIVSEVYGIELSSSEKKVFTSQVYLPIGIHTLTLAIDQDKEVNELDITNNLKTVTIEVLPGTTPISSWK